MDRRLIIGAATVASLVVFISLSALLKDTEYIWLQTRFLGLVSYMFLSVGMVIGEVKILTKGNSGFWAFRYHTPIMVFSIFLVFTHFVSAFFDSYKWGKYLKAADYLGFSFSDKWLAFLSLGTLAFYMMVLVGFTSSAKAVRSLGFGRWKLIHYLSYPAFFIAYVHSVNLGTDIKTSSLAPVMSPLSTASFLLVLALLMARIVKGANLVHDRTEVVLAVAFFVLLIVFSASLASFAARETERIRVLESQIAVSADAVDAYKADIAAMSNDTKVLMGGILEVRYGRSD